MLISLSPFGNLARFVTNKVHETVLLQLDGVTIPCSGTILAARSHVFENIIRENYKVPLHGFDGMSHQINQILELLYGGQVLLDSSSIAAFLRFSVQFEIEELVNLCAVWMESNNLFYQSEQILNEEDKTKRLDIIDRIDFRSGSVSRTISESDSEEYIDLEEICQSFSETNIEPDGDCKTKVAQSFSETNIEPDGDYIKTKVAQSFSETNIEPDGDCKTKVAPRNRGRLNAELAKLAIPSTTTNRDRISDKVAVKTGSLDNGGGNSAPPPGFEENQSNLTDRPELQTTEKLSGWKTVPVKSKAVSESIPQTRITGFKPNLAKWRQFSSEDLIRISSPMCPYPEFAKVEVVISWLAANTDLPFHQCQSLFDQFMANIDPVSLSDRYISLLADYLACWKEQLKFPHNFRPHIRSCYIPDDPNSNSKYFMHLWTLKKGDLVEMRNFHHVSFFASCPLCDKGTEESILKLVKQTPCYDLKIDGFRRKKQKYGIVYPVHFHSNSVFHWMLKTGSGKSPTLHSLITCNFEEIAEVLNNNENLKVLCLQLKGAK